VTKAAVGKKVVAPKIAYAAAGPVDESLKEYLRSGRRLGERDEAGGVCCVLHDSSLDEDLRRRPKSLRRNCGGSGDRREEGGDLRAGNSGGSGKISSGRTSGWN